MHPVIEFGKAESPALFPPLAGDAVRRKLTPPSEAEKGFARHIEKRCRAVRIDKWFGRRPNWIFHRSPSGTLKSEAPDEKRSQEEYFYRGKSFHAVSQMDTTCGFLRHAPNWTVPALCQALPFLDLNARLMSPRTPQSERLCRHRGP